MDKLIFECKDMKDKEEFPLKYTGIGEDLSPQFSIKNLSPNARTLAVTLEDVSHPFFKNFTHWLIYNIPAGEQIEGAIPGGARVPDLGNARQGLGYGWCRYAGPKPPKGRRHFYRFTIYALDEEIALNTLPTKGRFLKRAKGHILQKGSMVCPFRNENQSSLLKKKKSRKKIISYFLILCVALFLFLIAKFDIRILTGNITDTSPNGPYPDSMFVIEKDYCDYCDFSESLESINEKYHLNLRSGDSVFVIYKGTKQEPAPKPIDILYIFKT